MEGLGIEGLELQIGVRQRIRKVAKAALPHAMLAVDGGGGIGEVF